MLNRAYLSFLAVLIVAVAGLTSCVAKKTDTQSATADIPRIAFEKYTLPNGLVLGAGCLGHGYTSVISSPFALIRPSMYSISLSRRPIKAPISASVRSCS